MLRAQGINKPEDLRNIIPNFAVGTYQGETKITIRGVGQLIQASNPGVAIHIDGVYQPRSSMAGLTQVDMAGVEVLRGPQGTTYGRNASGGAVNYTTTAAGDELGGYVLGSFSEYNERRLQAAIDVPISDAVRTRLTVDSWDRGEGIYENRGDAGDAGEGDTLLARFRVDADFSDTVSGTFILSHAEVDGSFVMFDNITPIPETVRTRSAIPGLNDIFFTPPEDSSLEAPLQISHNTKTENVREAQSIAAILDWEINDVFDFKSITAVQTWEDLRVTENDLTNGDIIDGVVQEEGDTFTQEFNLTFSTDSASGVVGLFYLSDELEGDQNLTFRNSVWFGGPIPPGSEVRATWQPYENDSIALFADINYDLTDSLSLIAGVRYSEEEIDLDQSGAFFFNLPGLGLTALGPPNPCAIAWLADEAVTHETLDYNILTPKIGLGYAVSDNSNLYATYSEGFKSGGYGLRTGCGDSYDEEEVKSFEIGSKNVLADGRLRLNATAFFYDYEGYQIEQLVGFAFDIDNAEAAEVMGVELESSYVVNDNLIITANASHQRSEFTDHTSFDGLAPQLGVQDVSGNPLPGAPDTTVNLGVVYQTNSGFTFQVNASYKSEINFREFGNSEDAQDAYTVVNAVARWDSENDKINLRLFANNLTDEEYVEALFTSSLTENRIGTWATPRQIGFEARYNF